MFRFETRLTIRITAVNQVLNGMSGAEMKPLNELLVYLAIYQERILGLSDES